LTIGGRILRNVQGRIRQFLADGVAIDMTTALPMQLIGGDKPELPLQRTLLGYQRESFGVRIRWEVRFASGTVAVDDYLRYRTPPDGKRMIIRFLVAPTLPKNRSLEVRFRKPKGLDCEIVLNEVEGVTDESEDVATVRVSKSAERGWFGINYELPAARKPPKWDYTRSPVDEAREDVLFQPGFRPGYRAYDYPRPKTISGEDRIMPGAIAVRPKDGKVFVASMKTGELFTVQEPSTDGTPASFVNFGNGLYQDALSMLADDDALFVLHRRNLTKITEEKSGSMNIDRVAFLPQGIADAYDMGYGLVRDKLGRFVFGHAAYGDPKMFGGGSVVRLTPGKPPEEIAFGLRNALGWCAGPEGEIFFTDNQGDWVAANKLCHVVEGRFYGWPGARQKEHANKPIGKTTIWVPYAWAKSINGVAYDNTNGKFGPFAGQIFMAELMYGGAIIRANVEKVNGVYQGACFPFWGRGLLGPVTLAFDPRGKLYVGGITEPGWMAQPDRGALFRIDYTGEVPFEMQSIHVRPKGFKIVFTSPVDRKSAEAIESYRLEHYRYEYTGAYGSPELDRTSVKVDRVEVAADGRSAEIMTAVLVKDRVYMISASGVRSMKGEKLVQPTGAYTLNELPDK
jgi:hypothetical protein